MKTVLVTGGAGYIGSHACKALAAAGYLPVTFDNLVSGHRWAVRWGPLVEGDMLETHLVPLVLDAAAGIHPYITIFGDQYPTFDGTCIRDYIHVCDLAQAHVLALEALELGHAGAAYNLGNGCGFSVKEVIATARTVTGRPIEVRTGPARVGDPARLVAGASLIREELGWRPEHADLAGIIDSAWRHQRSPRSS